MIIVYAMLTTFVLVFIIAMIAGYCSSIYECKNPFPPVPPPPPPKQVESDE